MGGGYDAIVVGAGPNGLAAAITIARAKRRVLLIEANQEIGGGLRSEEITLPGFIHDVCSAVHPLAVASPFFRTVPLHELGVEWIHAPAACAHPFEDGTAALLYRSIDKTADQFGADGGAYRKLFKPVAASFARLEKFLLGPPLRIPAHPLLALRFGMTAVRSCASVAESRFRTEAARTFFAGLSAHSILPLDAPGSASFGLVLGTLGHLVGWPVPKGGSASIARALETHFRSLGGEIKTGWLIERWDELPEARAYLFDVPPRRLLSIAGRRFPDLYKRTLAGFRHGPGVFKMDWALRGPIPWANPRCGEATTVHLGSYREIVQSEKEAWQSSASQAPYVLLAQPSLFDPSRAPAGMHTAWAYCHVPNGSTEDMTDVMEGMIERYAPGFRNLILRRSSMNTGDLERRNPNLVGGDIGGGANDLMQIFGRPALSMNPYKTPAPGIFICSASTPPGGGVHGMCGYHAALAAIRARLS